MIRCASRRPVLELDEQVVAPKYGGGPRARERPARRRFMSASKTWAPEGKIRVVAIDPS